MNYSTLIFIAIGIILAAVLLNKKERKERDGTTGKEDEPVIDDLPDLNEKFLDNGKGKDVIALVKIFSPQDLIVLRSILDAEGIETYVKSNHFGVLSPSSALQHFNAAVISIYGEKSLTAKEIVEDYIQTLKKERDSGEHNFIKETFKTSSILVGIPLESSPFLPELLI